MRRTNLVQLQSNASSTILRFVAGAQEAAVGLVGSIDAAGLEGIATVALAAILDTKVGQAIAKLGTRVESHAVICVGAINQGTAVCSFCPATLVDPVANFGSPVRRSRCWG